MTTSKNLLVGTVLLGATLATASTAFADDTTATGTTATGTTATGTQTVPPLPPLPPLPPKDGSGMMAGSGMMMPMPVNMPGMSISSSGVMMPGMRVDRNGVQMGSGMVMPMPPMPMGSGAKMGSGMMIKENRSEIKENRQEMKMEQPFFTAYLRQDLTEDEKTAFKALVESFHQSQKTAMETTMAAMKTATTDEERKTILADAKTAAMTAVDAFVTSITPYVDAAKVDAFKEAVAKHKAMMEENMQLRQENQTMRHDMRDQKEQNRMSGSGNMTMSGSTNMARPNTKERIAAQKVAKQAEMVAKQIRAAIEAKIGTLSAEDQVTLLNKVAERVDTLLAAEGLSDTKRATLEAIGRVVDDMISDLSATDESTSVLNDVLN